MDTPTTGAPGGGAAPAAPSSGAPSAPAPSAPAATPATPATPNAPAAATPSAPQTPEPAPTRGIKESEQDFLSRYHTWQDKQPKPSGEEAKPAGAPTPAATPVAPVTPAAEAPKPTPTEPAKAAEEVKPAENELDKLGPFPASKLAEAFDKSPELKAKLEEAGVDTQELTGALRTAALVGQVQELFNGDLETAKYAREAAVTLGKMDLAATELKAGDLASTSKFIQEVLMPMSYILNEDGSVKMREVTRSDGSKFQVPETDGTVHTFLGNVRDTALEQVVADATMLSQSQKPEHKEVGERLLAAVQEIQNFVKAGEQELSPDLPENVRAEAERVRAERKSLNDRYAAEAEERYTNFRNDVLQSVNGDLDKNVIDPIIETSSLKIDPQDTEQVKAAKQFALDGIRTKIREGIFERLNSNELFLGQQEEKGRRGYTPQTKAALVKLYNRTAQGMIEQIARPILEAAGYQRISQTKAKLDKIAAQEKINKMEPTGPTSPAMPRSAQVDEKAIMAQARQELTKELRREPQTDEMIARYRQLVAKALQPTA